MRRLFILLSLFFALSLVTTMPVYAGFNSLSVPSPVKENVSQGYSFSWTADWGMYVTARGRWYDGAGLLVGGWDRYYGWKNAGQSIGSLDFFTYDCSSQGNQGRYTVSIDSYGNTQQSYTIQNNC